MVLPLNNRMVFRCGDGVKACGPGRIVALTEGPSRAKIWKSLKILAGVGQGRVLLADVLLDHEPGAQSASQDPNSAL